MNLVEYNNHKTNSGMVKKELFALELMLSQKELSPTQKFSCFVSFLSLFLSFSLYHANGVQTVDHKESNI
jgi:hypothetical protein